MHKGLALLIGLNGVDSDFYHGASLPLEGAENDAEAMAEIATNAGFKIMFGGPLLTSKATEAKVFEGIRTAAQELQDGDIFLLTCSAHGGQFFNEDPDKDDEDDDLDETWCLYDSQVLDDQIRAELTKFRPGVRVVVFSDTCHSGSVLELALENTNRDKQNKIKTKEPLKGFRLIPPYLSYLTYLQNKDHYDKKLAELRRGAVVNEIHASILLFAACKDNQLAADGPNGLFTSKVLEVWKKKDLVNNYLDFYKQILDGMPDDQTPQLQRIGVRKAAFEAEKPFTI